ncbi:MAG: ECF-family polymerase sigma factor [Myxococcaceae bacterium]|nr:ECF-family polymerase sigma factor [Myxococcaceae bacterium]
MKQPERVDALLARRPEFLSFLERRLGDRALAEDLLQDAFARLDKLDTLRDAGSATAWFYRVLRNAAIDHARRTQARAHALSAFAAELDPSANSAPEVQATCRCIAKLKDNLKPEYRAALESIELVGASVRDYAQQAGISPSNAGVRVFRARNELRKRVEQTCGACAAEGCSDCTCDPDRA